MKFRSEQGSCDMSRNQELMIRRSGTIIDTMNIKNKFYSSVNRRKKDQMQLDKAINIQMNKIEKEYSDVLNGSKDVSGTYKTTVPNTVYYNCLNLGPKDYDRFTKHYQRQKKELELGIIKNNLNQEVTDKIFEITSPKARDLRKKERNKQLREKVQELRERESK